MSEKMWAGRSDGRIDSTADDFNSSVRFDQRMYLQDIRGSVMHAAMLGKCGIITSEDASLIISTLGDIANDIEQGKTLIDPSAEDIHMFIEAELTSRIGDVGKRLHTARSRNDQVALDIRLYLKDESDEICDLIIELIRAVLPLQSSTRQLLCPDTPTCRELNPSPSVIILWPTLRCLSVMCAE